MVTNAQTVTIFCRWTRPDGKIKSMRRVLHNAVWREDGNSIARNTGVLLSESAFLQCFLEPSMEYVPAHDWAAFPELELDGKWTADFSNPRQSTIIVGHDAPALIADWGSSAEITLAEESFLRDVPGAKRIVSLPEDNRRGLTLRTHHILLRG